MSDSGVVDTVTAFPTDLGWFAMVGAGEVLKTMTFGHASKEAAIAALDLSHMESTRFGNWSPPLVHRIKAYAKGARDDFRDVPIDPGPQTDFQRKVLRCCRQIRYGKTISYADLAAKIGHPRAARAVGQCMAANRIPLVVPCHRVVAANSRLGGYSAAGGIDTKRRLLRLEKGARACTSG
jgi:methylated-DNA-[protein]-cysteine S-methyltransferase